MDRIVSVCCHTAQGIKVRVAAVVACICASAIGAVLVLAPQAVAVIDAAIFVTIMALLALAPWTV